MSGLGTLEGLSNLKRKIHQSLWLDSLAEGSKVLNPVILLAKLSAGSKIQKMVSYFLHFLVIYTNFKCK